ncbi:serine/threonine-protein kinase/endoribonuclease IRE2-like [Oscarella lobularis]|uniref:serine/threonine-protein kinase/endoribonuclease IRE2-like n=1 Tax=Oscarella lobularis TaxID=121494 RepID=UPI003313C176
MAAANSSGEGDEDVYESYQQALTTIVDEKKLGEVSETLGIRRSSIYLKDIRTTGRHGIDEQRFAIKFTRYEGSDMPKDRLRELEALKDMSGSENILAQFACEHRSGGKFTSVYQLLEPWEFTLSDTKLNDKLIACGMSRLEVLKGLVKGLDFLSRCKTPIVHRGISPEAIRICKNGDIIRTKIADFDLAKRMFSGNFSTHSGSGVDDWKPLDKEATVKYDIFGAGLIFHHVLTNGHEISHRKLYRSATAHLLKKKDEREENKLDLSELDKMITERQENPRKSDPEFFHLGAFRRLIGSMLSRYPDKRPSAEEVSRHCALLSREESITFFETLDSPGDSVTEENYAEKLEDCFPQSECNKPLARFVRNRIVHFESSGRGNPEVKKAFGDKESLLKYFLNLFPDLMVNAWELKKKQ